MRRVRFLEGNAIDLAAQEIAEAARAVGARVALIGGVALQVYGSPRLTTNVDVVADRPWPGLEPGERLAFGAVSTTTTNGIPVKVVLRRVDYEALYAEALASAQHVDDYTLPVVSIEHLIATKMAAHRPKDRVDVDFLLASGQADLTAATEVIRAHLGLYAAAVFGCWIRDVELSPR